MFTNFIPKDAWEVKWKKTEVNIKKDNTEHDNELKFSSS